MQTKLALSKGIYRLYTATVNGNENTTHRQTILKMKRNIQLAHQSERPDGSIHYKYGSLHFIVANGRVVWMQNNCKPEKGWKRDDHLYLKLNKELGIEEDVTLFDLKVRNIKCNLKYNLNKLKWKIRLQLNPVK
ncbi:hypothetical protein [Bacillus sp. FJAT-22090]|uniref:hypothetical protein n=1 Tax=Bacillus sp. FJAT-22090 TaxID=1581038 RepID=UPI0011A3165F|nr:hypothetical protein [Bacillus sp. FJAT-22090]